MKKTLLLALAAVYAVVPGALSAQGLPYDAVPAVASGFSASVAIAGDQILVGRSGAETRMATNPQPGVLFVFEQTGSDAWTSVGEITPSDGTVGDQFGSSVWFSDEGLLVGAPGTDGARGVAYFFVNSSSQWAEVLRLDPGAKANSGAGTAVALANDQAFLGAPGRLHDLARFNQPAPAQPGVVYVFAKDTDGGPALVQRLTDPEEDGADRFGSSLLVAKEDLFVGAPGRDGGRGVVHQFARTSHGWSLTNTLELVDGRAGDRFGASIALSGASVLISAPGRDRRGAVYVFEPGESSPRPRALNVPDVPAGARFGSSLATDGDAIWVGAPGASSGSGAVYRFEGEEHGHVQTVTATDFGLGATFGTSIAAHGSRAVIGAGQADLRLGAAAVFERSAQSGTWRMASTLRDPGRNPMVAITGDEVTCEDGVAAEFSCLDVDLVSFLPLDELGAGHASIANDIWGWTDPATGREYVLLGKPNGTSFVDITDPGNPLYLGELPLHRGANENLWRDVKTYDDHAFIVADGAGAHGMQIFDLTQLRDVTNAPVMFEETAHYDGIFSSHNIVINEETGFAISVGGGGGAEPCGGGLHMIDIRDPRSPTFAGCFIDGALGGVLGPGYTHDAQCVIYRGPDDDYRDREICFQASLNALGISDITDKDEPVLLAKADYPGVVAAHQGWLTEDHRYFFMGDELDEEGGTVDNTRTLVWDIAELDDPILATEYFAKTKAIDHNMYVRGNLLYQSNLLGGLRILDISSPENPVEVAFFDTVPYADDLTAFGGTWSNYPFFPSGVIAVSSWNEGLFLLRKRETELVP